MLVLNQCKLYPLPVLVICHKITVKFIRNDGVKNVMYVIQIFSDAVIG